MSVPSGLAASLGLAAESTYGTFVTPTRWLEMASCDLRKVKNVKQGGGLAAGRLVDLASRRVITTLGAEGSVEMEVHNKQMGLLLNMLMGGTPTVVQQAATTAYLQTHTLSDNTGKFFTSQLGVPDQAGTVRPYTFLGTKVMAAEFSGEVSDDGLLMSTFELLARDVTEAQALTAPSYQTGVRPFPGTSLNVKVGSSYGAEAAVSGVRAASFRIERPQDDSRFYAGAAGLRGEPLVNDKVMVTAHLDVDYIDKTIWADRFAADTNFSLVLEWVGPIIASTYAETFRGKFPSCFINGDPPSVDGGPDVVKHGIDVVAQFDGTNAAAIIEYMSVDTAI